MHQHNIKRNFLQHHSISICLARSIPIGCMAALLLSIVLGGIPSNIAYAAWSPGCIDINTPPGYVFQLNSDSSACVYVPILKEPGVTVLSPTVSMTIDSGSSVSKQIQAEYNKANYSAHTVAVSASNISAYTLTLSNVSMAGPSTLTGVSNVKGSALSNNTWGYGWDSTSTSNDNVTYSSASSKNLGDVEVSNNSVNLSKKLVFATKFGEDANSGGYKVRATLSLVATPATVTEPYVHWDNLVYMQDMTADACSEATTSTPEKTLTDIRDNSTYTVKKLSDGKCWMTQNLRITGDSMKIRIDGWGKITKYDSDVTTDTSMDFMIPISAASGFTGTDNNAAYYSGDTAYGAYYSWYTATAGTGTSSVSSGDATGSICPKNWRLPTKTEYETLYGKGKSGWTTNGGKNGYWVGAANATGGAFFPAAGRYYNSSPDYVGSVGHYWSSTALDGSYAYFLVFGSGTLGTNGYDKYIGFSVRCVAK